MILYSLRCAADHHFDAWFRNGAAYDASAAAGALACPVCGSHAVTKAPMAPRIGKRIVESAAESHVPPQTEADVGSAAPQSVKPADPPAEAPPFAGLDPADVRRALTTLRAQVENACDYVGDRFPEEARRIHYKEAAPRPIYGEASDSEAEALREEGVTFSRIPWLPRSDS